MNMDGTIQGGIDHRSEPIDQGNERQILIRPKHGSTAASSTYTARSSCSSNGSVSEAAAAAPSAVFLPPKVGTRFSKESARVLRQWLDTHKDHPFPSREDNEMLQRFTGLSKVQIKTWFANARRRRRLPESSSRSASVSKPPGGGVTIPQRPGTPMPTPHGGRSSHTMDPMERWVDSPPEDEPALVRDIARAVASGNQAFLRRGFNHDDSGDSSFDDALAASASRIIVYSSTGSRSSSMDRSNSSHGSISSKKAPTRGHRRSRRGRPGQGTAKTSLFLPDGRYQCTFCTETFRTKYDWSRHEKSLHVPIERWLCSPRGPVEVSPSSSKSCCVFCGHPEPTCEHLATHNPDTCKQKTFNRKDHLKQHLRLVHGVGGLAWVIEAWKAPSLKIRSRCGFCGIGLETWSDREDHLADHFKLGNTMANWTGDWGFEEHIMSTVESYIPPYVIDYDRKSPFPFMASGQAPSSPRSAYELLSLELAFFLYRHIDQRKGIPSNQDLRLQACRVIFASEALTSSGQIDGGEATSWLRDLMTFDEEVSKQARFGPLLSQAESRLAIIRINGKSMLFESCPLERRLKEYVESAWEAQGLVPRDSDLQAEAYRILTCAEEQLETKTPDFVTNWFTKMVTTSTDWLEPFKRRTILPMAALETLSVPASASQPVLMDINWTPGQDHTDSILSLGHFMDHIDTTEPALGTGNHQHAMQSSTTGAVSFSPMATNAGHGDASDMNSPTSDMQHARLDFGFYVLNDANYHRWFDIELKRWATMTMSSENPAQHVPSDGEIQHQARLLLYDDGDPWNITEADNPEWLDRFKRDIGILPAQKADDET